MITAFRPHGDPAGYSPVIRVECFSTPAPTAALRALHWHSMDIYADILPGRSLGGFALLECYDQRLGLEYTPISTHAIRYSFPNDTVELNVDVQTGIIYKISALTNYKGTLLGSIHVGDSIPDVLQNDPSFIYDDFEMAYFSEGSPGVALEPDVHDPWPEDFPYLRIDAITIFDAEYIRNARKLTLDYTC